MDLRNRQHQETQAHPDFLLHHVLRHRSRFQKLCVRAAFFVLALSLGKPMFYCGIGTNDNQVFRGSLFVPIQQYNMSFLRENTGTNKKLLRH